MSKDQDPYHPTYPDGAKVTAPGDGRVTSQSRRNRCRRGVFRRDGLICHWCGVLTSRSLKPPEPTAATLDHLIPASCGGETTQNNLVVACHACNNRRGNLSAEAFRALISKS